MEKYEIKVVAEKSYILIGWIVKIMVNMGGVELGRSEFFGPFSTDELTEKTSKILDDYEKMIQTILDRMIKDVNHG